MALTVKSLLTAIEKSERGSTSYLHFFEDDTDRKYAIYVLKAVCAETGWSYTYTANKDAMTITLFREG